MLVFETEFASIPTGAMGGSTSFIVYTMYAQHNRFRRHSPYHIGIGDVEGMLFNVYVYTCVSLHIIGM